MSLDAATCIAVQAVLIWRQGILLPARTWGLVGPYAALLQELQGCLLVCEDWPLWARAQLCADLWSAIRAWPRFIPLADAVDTYEGRAMYAPVA